MGDVLRTTFPDPPRRSPDVRHAGLRAVAFDFERRVDLELSAPEAYAALGQGLFVWFDVQASSAELPAELLEALGLASNVLIVEGLRGEPVTQVARYEECLQLTLATCASQGSELSFARVDCLLGERFLLTVHRAEVAFLAGLRSSYREDFRRFARTPSFLLYELWDQWIEQAQKLSRTLEERVEALQLALLGEEQEQDTIFQRVARLGTDLLRFRKALVPARSALHDLATRRSLFVSETTQRFLANLVGSVDRLLENVLADRDILSDALNLHVSVVSHRSNRVMKRLTAVSVIFLPLTFLCGVYGMNFDVLPELHWRYGYALFWASVAVIALLVAWLSKRARLL